MRATRTRAVARPTGSEKVYSFGLHDLRGEGTGTRCRIRHPPTVHIARGFDGLLPALKRTKRPIICISDWQYETETQEHFWNQAKVHLIDELGEGALSRSLVLVAGDMASSDDRLLGAASDAVPRLHWLHETFPDGDVLRINGNHDLMAPEHLAMTNTGSSGIPCLLPHGRAARVPLMGSGEVPTTQREAIEEIARPLQAPTAPVLGKAKPKRKGKASKKTAQQDRQWRLQNPDQAELVEAMNALHDNTVQDSDASPRESVLIAGVHGIPASHNEGMKKIDRESYFQALESACLTSGLDILVTHSNPCLPGQERTVKGVDAPRIFRAFQLSSAYLFVHGHMHTDPAVSVLDNGKVVVNSDCRVVAFVPAADAV